MKRFSFLLFAVFALASCSGHRDGEYVFQLFTTNDVHGKYFDSLYVGSRTQPSLEAVFDYVDSVRRTDGEETVILVDAGDCLQGDNAAYYYNYVDTVTRHVYARIAEYMGYDAVVVGNHDIETGHPVYDRMKREMKVPFLAANAVDTKTGRSYFGDYVILKKQGFKIAVLGYTNPNIPGWLSPVLWSGMEFESLVPAVQEDVDKVLKKEKPDVVIVAVHSATGSGDGTQLESQGLDLFDSLSGVDFLVCSHDHRPYTAEKEDIVLINSGSHCRNIGHGTLKIKVENGRVVSKSLSAGLIPVDKSRVDTVMRNVFRGDFAAVKAFTLQEVGTLDIPLSTRASYEGMCAYMNLLHTLSLSCSSAGISFAAPLTFNGYVKPGTLIYNDLFTIYPYENQLFVVNMTGREIRDYLEYSYDKWINTVTSPQDHVLKITDSPDARTGQKRWSFVNRSYNFDSAGGLRYTVDITAQAGDRVEITALADGTVFEPDSVYRVAMTSYRASGGGGLIREGAGITGDIEERIVERCPEIRNLLYDYLKTYRRISASEICNPDLVGEWKFVPESLAAESLEKDMRLLFGR